MVEWGVASSEIFNRMFFSYQKLLLIVGSVLVMNPVMGFTIPDSSLTEKKIRFPLSIDSRSTWMNGQKQHINGIYTGVIFGKKAHKLSIGYYWLGYDAPRQLIDWRHRPLPRINSSYYTKTDLQFISLGYWYPIIHNYRWTFSVPVEVGLGRELARYRENIDFSARGHYYFVPYQFGLYGEYRIKPWAGLNVQAGYRNSFSNGEFGNRFEGVYYRYGIRLYLGKIYNELRKLHRKRTIDR